MTEEELFTSLDAYFQRGIDSKRFIDTARIPFICDDLKGIRRIMEEKFGQTGSKDAEKDHETRIRALEKNTWIYSGIASAVAVLGMWILENYFKK